MSADCIKNCGRAYTSEFCAYVHAPNRRSSRTWGLSSHRISKPGSTLLPCASYHTSKLLKTSSSVTERGVPRERTGFGSTLTAEGHPNSISFIELFFTNKIILEFHTSCLSAPKLIEIFRNLLLTDELSRLLHTHRVYSMLDSFWRAGGEVLFLSAY